MQKVGIVHCLNTLGYSTNEKWQLILRIFLKWAKYIQFAEIPLGIENFDKIVPSVTVRETALSKLS